MNNRISGKYHIAWLVVALFIPASQMIFGQIVPTTADPRVMIVPDPILSPAGAVKAIEKEQAKKLKISDEQKSSYKLQAADKNATIVRLLASLSCSSSLVLDIRDTRCAENPGVTVASFYSFRRKEYGEGYWTDIALTEDELKAGNRWHTIGMLVDLGESAELSKLDHNVEVVKALWNFPSAKSSKDENKQSADLINGVALGIHRVTSKLKVELNHTYLVRTIAYRTDIERMVTWMGRNWYHDDTLFAIRVVALDQQDTLTLAWKKISQRPAAVLKDEEKNVEK